MLRTFLVFICYITGAIFLLLTAVVYTDIVDIYSADKKLLAEMKLRVAAVREFQVSRGRLPEDDEINEIWSKLPKGKGVFYRLQTIGHVEIPRGGKEVTLSGKGDWVVSVWMGEHSEYYSSWDDHYSPTQPWSWYNVEGPMLFSPLIAMILFVVPRGVDLLLRKHTTAKA